MGVSDQLRQTKKGNLSYERHTSETDLKVTDKLVNHDLNSVSVLNSYLYKY